MIQPCASSRRLWASALAVLLSVAVGGTAAAQPKPPDTTAPWRADESPAPGATSVPVTGNVAFCLYDDERGVNTGSVQVTLNDGTGPVVYSASSNAAAFSLSANDPACTSGVDGNNANGVRVTVTPIAAFLEDVDVTVTPAAVDKASNPYSGGSYLFHTESSGGAATPMVLFYDPAPGAVVGGMALVRVYGHYTAGLHPTTPVQLSFSNAWDAASRVTLTLETLELGFAADDSRGVYDLLWDTVNGVLADDGVSFIGQVGPDHDGSATVYARVYGADASFRQAARTVTVANVGGAPRGGGTLLRREAGGSLCRSCHDLKTHASAETSDKYGAWGFDCWACHEAHGTRNLMLVRETLQTPAGPRTVDLRDLSGGRAEYGLAELPDALGGSNGLEAGAGICETCHTKTQHADGTPLYRATGEGPNGHYTSGCLSCHDHATGFKGSGDCSSCHGAPPATPSVGNVHLVHDGSGVAPTAYGTAGNGSTQAAYVFPCGKCHGTTSTNHMDGTAAGTPADPLVVEVAFDAAEDPELAGATYAVGTAYTETGPDGKSYRYTEGTCSNVYCHGEFAGGNTANDPVFRTGGQTCGACHGASSATPPSGGSHATHAGTLGLPCATCHEATVDGGGAIADRSVHVNGAADWDLDRTAAGVGTAATYGAAESGAKNPPSTTYATCDGVYCHSNGLPIGAAAIYQTPTWGGAIGGACLGCHGGGSGAAQVIGVGALGGSAAHAIHVGDYGFACDDCHTATVQDRTSDTVLATGQTTHLNGAKDVGLGSWPVDQSGAGWDGAAHACSGTYCHSPGTDATAPFAGALTVAWTDTLDCGGCHGTSAGGGLPDYADGSPKANSHAAHASHPCVTCHADTVDAVGAVTGHAAHVDGTYDVRSDASGFTVSTAGSPSTPTVCAGITCHGGGSATWGATLGCPDCHLGTGDVDSFADGDGSTGRIDTAEWTSAGHGASAAYPSGLAGAGFDGQGARGCAYCHDDGVAHATGGNFFRLANTGLGENGTCLVCHGSSHTGYDPDGASATYAAMDGTDVDSAHFGAKHGGANQQGGRFCWDCHDPHGDDSVTGHALWYMVQRRPAEDVDAEGIPAILAAAVEFRPAVGGAAGALDHPDYVLGGLCRNCHDGVVGHYNKTTSDGHNLAAATARDRCTDCHTHADGFQGSGCNGCHDAPPPTPSVGNVHAVHDGSGVVPETYGLVTSGSTQTAYVFPCGKCHGSDGNQHMNSTAAGTAGDPLVVQVVFDDTVDPKAGASAAYAAGTAYTETGPDGKSYRYTEGTCSNVYCHGEFAGGNTVNDPIFKSGTQTCGACHGASGTTPPAGGSHARHAGTAAGQYGYGCDLCHEATADATPAVIDRSVHVDGAATWDLRRTDARVGASATYSGAEAGAKNPPSTTYGSCANLYCHSDGRGGYATPTWGGAVGCTSCHGSNAGSGAPMASGAHGAHVNNASVLGTDYGCVRCHAATVSDDATIADTGLHTNAARDVSGAGIGGWNGGTRECSNVYCHSSGQATPVYRTVSAWDSGATYGCSDCHGADGAFSSVAGEPNYANGGAGAASANSHRAHVSSAADCATCHADTTADGTSILSGATTHTDGNRQVVLAAAYDDNGGTSNYDPATKTCSSVSCHGSGSPQWGGTMSCLDCHGGTDDVDSWDIADGLAAVISTSEWTSLGHGGSTGDLPLTCDYCHDASVGHGDAGNPFRLANVSGDVNGNCLVCHGAAGTGYDPGAGTLTAATKIDAHHYGADHGTGNDGGRRCWDCHDPHGDDANIKMIGDTLVSDAGDTWGLSASRTGTVVFTGNTTPGDFAREASPFDGVCNACHVSAGHYTASSGDGHGMTQVCTGCHAHDQGTSDAFKPAGGCLGCHETSAQGPRRAVGADFGGESHHVGNGGATMGGTLTDNDCVICHAEGTVSAGKVGTVAAYHGPDGGSTTIDLRSADAANTVYPYDRDAVAASAGAAANWNSGNSVWATQTSTNLDPFCLTCHDSDGAQVATTLGDAGASASNPFADAAITNEYDQLNRGAVVNIKDMVAGSPPPDGMYSRHAIRGFAPSRYTTQQIPNSYWNQSGIAWNDTSVMGCADCHTTDGANGSAGNAHGSAASEYLLKDASGGAAEGRLGLGNYVCYACHAVGSYDAGVGHTPNAGDYQDYADQAGSARTPVGNTGGSIYGMACSNCHGGLGFGTIHGTSQVIGVGQDGGSGSRQAYRFMNGGSMRYYDPAGWTGSSATCYTLSSGDSFGGCTKHSKGGSYTRPFTRPLNY